MSVSTMSMERRREIVKEADILMKQGRKEEGYDLIHRLIRMFPMLYNDFYHWLKISPKYMLSECYNIDDAVAAYGEQWLES